MSMPPDYGRIPSDAEPGDSYADIDLGGLDDGSDPGDMGLPDVGRPSGSRPPMSEQTTVYKRRLADESRGLAPTDDPEPHGFGFRWRESTRPIEGPVDLLRKAALVSSLGGLAVTGAYHLASATGLRETALQHSPWFNEALSYFPRHIAMPILGYFAVRYAWARTKNFKMFEVPRSLWRNVGKPVGRLATAAAVMESVRIMGFPAVKVMDVAQQWTRDTQIPLVSGLESLVTPNNIIATTLGVFAVNAAIVAYQKGKSKGAASGDGKAGEGDGSRPAVAPAGSTRRMPRIKKLRMPSFSRSPKKPTPYEE